MDCLVRVVSRTFSFQSVELGDVRRCLVRLSKEKKINDNADKRINIAHSRFSGQLETMFSKEPKEMRSIFVFV